MSGRSFKAPHEAEGSRGSAEGKLFGAHRLYNLTCGGMHDRLEGNAPEGRGQEQRAQSSLLLLQSQKSALAKQLVHKRERVTHDTVDHAVSGQWQRRVLVVDGFPELETRSIQPGPRRWVTPTRCDERFCAHAQPKLDPGAMTSPSHCGKRRRMASISRALSR